MVPVIEISLQHSTLKVVRLSNPTLFGLWSTRYFTDRLSIFEYQYARKLALQHGLDNLLEKLMSSLCLEKLPAQERDFTA